MKNDELINILKLLVSASIDVVQDMADVSAKRGKVDKKFDSIVSSGISTVLGIYGKYKGRIIIDMDFSTATALAGKINEENFSEVDETVLYTIMEVNNIIAGKVVSDANNINKEYNFKITPPGIFSGEEVKISSPNLQVYRIEISTEVGNYYVSIGFEGVDI